MTLLYTLIALVLGVRASVSTMALLGAALTHRDRGASLVAEGYRTPATVKESGCAHLHTVEVPCSPEKRFRWTSMSPPAERALDQGIFGKITRRLAQHVCVRDDEHVHVRCSCGHVRVEALPPQERPVARHLRARRPPPPVGTRPPKPVSE